MAAIPNLMRQVLWVSMVTPPTINENESMKVSHHVNLVLVWWDLSLMECIIAQHVNLDIVIDDLLCEEDCSGAGTCNYNNGTCSCLPHRKGTKCEIQLCSQFSSLCLTCTETECLQCTAGYYLTGDTTVCSSCYDFDPRCAGCIKEEGCTVCADSTLTSVRRSGYRSSDPKLPAEEVSREFSITLPFGTKSPESFAEAESYFVAATTTNPLRNNSVSCSQGLRNDSSWSCTPYEESHIVCGHYGVFRFTYPNYEIAESAKYIRMTVLRSGGGYGNVTINYYIQHITTNDSDVVATAPYTTVQQLDFKQGVVEMSFLITILDDNLVEENEVFQVVLETPEGGGSVGAQFRANVTIIDDDLNNLSPKLTYFLANSTTAHAGKTFSVDLQARQGNGEIETTGGQLFLALLENNISAWSAVNGKRQSARLECNVTELTGGRYRIQTSQGVREQGVYQLRAWNAFPKAIQGQYYYDAFFENLAVNRLDHAVNFTWGSGRLIPHGSDYISIRWHGAIRADFSGLYYFSVDADDYARLWVDGKLLLDHFHERSVYEEEARTIYLQHGKLYEIVLEYVEVNGNAYAHLRWAYNGGSLHVIPQENYYSLFEIDGSPVEVNIISTATDAGTTECYGEGLYSATALTAATFTVCPRDIYGNLRDDDDEFYLSSQLFQAVLTVQDNVYQGQGVSTVTPILTYSNQSHCFEGYYIPQQAGLYQLNITFQSTPDSLKNHVRGSPFYVEVSPTKAFGPYSEIFHLPSPLYAEAGYCYNFTVVLRDASHNLLLHGGDKLLVYVYRVDYYNLTIGQQPYLGASPRPSLAPTSAPTTLSNAYQTAFPPRLSDSGQEVIRYGIVSDLGNGNYSVRICPVIAGIYEIHVLLNGRGVSNQPVRLLDRFYSLNLLSGRGSYTGQYVGRSPSEVVVSHTEASVITSTVEGEGLVTATTAVPAYFLLTARDPYDNVLRTSYLTPTVSLRLDLSPHANTSVWNYQNGSFLLEYIPQVAGINNITVFVNGFQILGSPFSVFVHVGKTKAKYSYAFGDGLVQGTTGVTSYFQLFAYDGNDNREVFYNDTFLFQITGSNTINGTLQPCPWPRVNPHPACDPSDLLGGYYFGSFVPLVTGTIEIRVFLNDSGVLVEISNSPFYALISPSKAKAENSDVSGVLYDNVAGQWADVSIQLRDYFGNKLIKSGGELELALIGVAAEWGTVQPFNIQQGLPNQYNYKGFYYPGYPIYYGNVVDHLDGSYTLSYRAEQTGQYVLRLALAEKGLNVTYFNDTHFGLLVDGSFTSEEFILSLKGRPVNYGSSWSWTGDLGGPPGTDGNRGYDTYYGKYVSLVADNISVDLSYLSPYDREYITNGINHSQYDHFRQQYWSARWTGMITPTVAEMHKFSVELDENSELRMWIGGLGLETNMSYCGDLVLNVTASRRNLIGYYNFTNMKHREIVVELIHYRGDAHLAMFWETMTMQKVAIPSSAFTHWRNISHYNTTIHPATLCSSCSTVWGNALVNATVGHDQSFLLYARDIFGNLLQKGGSGPSMLAVGNDGVVFRSKIVDYGNSTYLVRYYSTRSGIFRMYVTVGCCPPSPSIGYLSELQEMSPLLVEGSPFLLTIQPDALAVERCVATGKGLIGGHTGELLNFTISHRDRYYNPTTIDPTSLLVQVIIKDSFNGDLILPSFLQINKSSSSTIIAYQVTHAGILSFAVQFSTTGENGFKYMIGSPFSVLISPFLPAPEMTICRGLGIKQAAVNRTTNFEIALRDQYGNGISVGGAKFFVRLIGDANFTSNSLTVVPACRDNLNGKYACYYMPGYASGPHLLIVKLLHQPLGHPGGAGLIGKYFDSPQGALLAKDELARAIRTDPKVQFVWNRDDGIIPLYSNTPSSTVEVQRQLFLGQSVRWEGYLSAPRDDLFSIKANAVNMNVSIFLDEELMFDNWRQISRSRTLLTSSSYTLRIIATVDKSIASGETIAIDLRWSTPTLPERSISQFFLYEEATDVNHSPFPITVSA
eukprot:scaffold139_cov260-Ochromonas_danica.AAC.9